ncbi:unnamed protein product [Symbiodinium natans]|uniref:Poly [ADP-ribose] polymerase n=1 Tax=Symbiodinium natans TaxID=878477 RepID=A0A812JQX5_9DINO|nr:unnamed protein product [Symbiodinium natans]
MLVESKLSELQDEVLRAPLDASRNEMLLLHGTKPEHLHDILFEGLDPHLSKEGLFGKGTYLAEDAAKIDQYLTQDPEWKGNKPEHELYNLHKKLYERGVKHATHVYYALVCRVALGDPFVTKDGKTCARTEKPIFVKGRKEALRHGRTSLVAELGGKIQRYREFVIFDPAALRIDFLAALKRVRHYCDCGQAAVRRTVTHGQPENFGREILFCGEKKCRFIHMLPQCYCGRAAGVGTKMNGEKYFRCGSKRDFCDFKRLCYKEVIRGRPDLHGVNKRLERAWAEQTGTYSVMHRSPAQLGEHRNWFLRKSIEVYEGRDLQDCGDWGNCSFFSIAVLRDPFSSGAVVATIEVLNKTNATQGVGHDYDILPPLVVWEDGDYSVKAFLIFIFDDDIAEPTKVLHLGLDATPQNMSVGSEIEVFIMDDKDGGTIAMTPSVARAREEFGTGECLIYADRQGGSSGATGLSLSHARCLEGGAPEAEQTTDFALIVQEHAEVSWQDGEIGPKCALLSLSFADYYSGAFRGWDRKPAFLLVIPDATREPDERVCLDVKLTENSTAALEQEQIHVVLLDVDIDAKLSLNCTRGADCLLDLSQTWFWEADRGSLQDAYANNYKCRPCEDAQNSSEAFNFTVDASRSVHLKYVLQDSWPGDKLLCWCIFQGSIHLASMELQGPSLKNAARCAKSWPSCAIHDLHGVGFQVDNDHLRVLRNCWDPEDTPTEVALGSLAVYDEHGEYKMRSFESMRQASPGIFELCWCRKTAATNCTDSVDFSVSAGSFVYTGPNSRSQLPPYQLGKAEPLIVSDVHGIDLTADDRAMILPSCGQLDPAGLNTTAAYDLETHSFNFGKISTDLGLLATTYKVCWCQPSADWGYACDTKLEFRAEIGSIDILCPYRQTDPDGDGICAPCPLMIQTAGGGAGAVCVVEGLRFVEALVMLAVSVLFSVACATGLRCSRTGGLVQGVPRLIEDVSQESGKLILTVVGHHNLSAFTKSSSIPVTLWHTGHFLLDSTPSKPKAFRVRPFGLNTMELLDAQGRSLEFRADTSMGLLRLSMPRALLHSVLRGVKLPLFLQMLLLAGLWVYLSFLLEPSWPELAGMLALVCLLALAIASLWRFLLRPLSSLTVRLERFAKELRERRPDPKPCKKGPDRAVAVRDVLELEEKFGAFIKDRNMYYIDPNILQHLTARHKLSYAELVGPQTVQWFVSHWWGTQYRVYCMTLQRHAKAVCETSDEAIWGATSYWICTFSNNQHQIKEELGSSHRESSFYLALHSGVCRGTCMILDEMAMPLKRSWCLFELLQTIHLEKTQANFRGLLFCTENGVLNFGASTVEMSMQIGERLSGLSLKDAEATTEKDKNMITELVLQEMDSFEKIDAVLREHISEALGICRDRVDDDFDALFRKLGTLKEHLAVKVRDDAVHVAV